MSLFNFSFTDNYKEITKTSVFRSNLKKLTILCLLTLSVGIILGLFFSNHTIAAVKYVAIDSGSAQIIDAAASSPSNAEFYSFLAIFFNNLLISGLLIVFPIHIYNLQKQATDNWSKKSFYQFINPLWISYIMVAFQMMMVGNFIGFAIPIINNIPLVVTSLIPHGIIEIPIILVSSAIVASFATREINIKFVYNDCLNFFIRFITPVVMLAAFIEAYITPIIVTLI